MAILDEYNPIDEIVFRTTRFKPRGLVVVVGANSSGKTRFLRDIETVLTASNVVNDSVLMPRPSVAQHITTQLPPSVESYLQELVDQGILTQPGPNHHCKVIYHSPGKDSKSDTSFVWGEQLHAERGAKTGSLSQKHAILQNLSTCLITSLFIDNRLRMHQPVGRIGFGDRITTDLHALFHDQQSLDILEDETFNVFGKCVWLDTASAAGALILRASDVNPPHKDRLNAKYTAEQRQLSEEGDGLKSYAGILMVLLVGRTPVRLIDEPELCLHPPQAYALGQFIGRRATSPHHVTFVSTHSSELLRGVLDAAPEKVSILRLTREGNLFDGQLLDNVKISELLKKPTARAVTVLDGVFARASLIVEGDGDRDVYAAAGEKIKGFHRDIAFVPVNGIGGIPGPAAFYNGLGTPVVVIADLDMARNSSFPQVLAAICPEAEQPAILDYHRRFRAELEKLPPTLSPDDAKKRLGEISNSITTWDNGADDAVMSKLSELRKDIEGATKLKKGGVRAYGEQPAIQELLNRLISECKKFGLFLVPVGELEWWLDLNVSREKKDVWAQAAIAKLRASTDENLPIVAFVREIHEYLSSRMR
jgi:hypothetical protein